jgi:7-carboxy-7-deazaguanine synthase (Cx14CxxC type)
MADNYRVKEMVFTLQGEGAKTGTAVVLLRFEGCNLHCSFCDTDFTGTDGEGGGVFATAQELAEAVQKKWKSSFPLSVLCTGGEPLLQLDGELIKQFHTKGFNILLETNGTLYLPENLDWVCVSPKADTVTVLNGGDEIKIVFPQNGIDPHRFEKMNFKHFWIQPLHNTNYEENLKASIEYCLSHPKWRLSLQTHRFTGIP